MSLLLSVGRNHLHTMFYRPTSTKLVKSLDFWSQRNAVNSVLLLNQPRTYFFFHLWRFILQREEAVDKSLLQVFRWHSTDRLRMGQHKTTANINAGTVGCITTHLKNSFFHPEILFQQRKINVISSTLSYFSSYICIIFQFTIISLSLGLGLQFIV